MNERCRCCQLHPDLCQALPLKPSKGNKLVQGFKSPRHRKLRKYKQWSGPS
ncbi:hypothetical protein phiGM223_31 [Pseudomonas phage phiGM22-3]|uniref:Uncharacterized protein n=1 Tax=Pseudomonas phage phiGM22-3 TaxID=2816462 RepID=A0A8T8IV37_9CAUD|nr:hypothetical protein phiGM223_31 [Pseudomonas phage phiGM22-3]